MPIVPYISLAKTFFQTGPSTLTLFVTNRCNARCRMCFNWKNMDEGKKREELSVDEISKIADNFKGLHSLIISGGEPFLRKDLGKIIKEFHKRSGTRHISIPTNLFCADAPEMIQEIASDNPDLFFRILISLDGIGKDHDDIRGHEGGFEKLMSNLERLKEYKKDLKNLSLNSVIVLSSFNADKIIPLIEFAGGLELDDIKLIYVRGDTREAEAKKVSPELYKKCIMRAEEMTRKNKRTRSFYNDLFSSVSLVAKEEIVEALESGRLPRPCNAGLKFLVISDTGELFPCETLPQPLGSLREHNYSVESIMRTPQANKVLDHIKAEKCFCTMDCNAISNVIYSPSCYLRVFRKLFRFYR